MSGGTEGAKRTCPQCGKKASGNFCQECGASLGPRFCDQCGAKSVEGARFCNRCGAVFAGAPAGGYRKAAVATVGGANAPWWIGGAALFAVIAVMGWRMVTPGPTEAPGATGTPATAGPAGTPPDISSMTPRERADRLYDRVMRTASAGDTAGAMAFQPMGLQAYELAEPLDLDGIFHVVLLQMLSDPEAAFRTAQRILEVEPEHLLGLGAAADAAAKAGDEATATDMYRKLLDVYEAQQGLRTEYQEHSGYLAQAKAAAEAFLAGR